MWHRKQRERGKSAPVVFVVQWLSTFELVEPVIAELGKRGVPTRLLVVAERVGANTASVDYRMSDAEEVRSALIARGYEPLPVPHPGDEAAIIRAMTPCAVFLPTPYLTHRHPELAPSQLGLPVHFVNYGFRIEAPDEGFDNPFFDYCDTVYAETASDYDLMLARGLDPSQILLSGHPGLDVWDREPLPRPQRPTVLWCPWWRSRWDDASPAYSTFFAIYDAFLDEVARRPDIDFVFRPHPLLWEQMLIEGRWTTEEEARFRARLETLPNIELRDADRNGHLDDLGAAWGMVTDGVSFFEEFTYTGKPLLLTKQPGNPGWGPEGVELEQLVDVCDWIEGLPEFLDHVVEGIDEAQRDLRQERARAILGRSPRGAAPVIADHVAEGRRQALANRPVSRVGKEPSRLPIDLMSAVAALNELDGPSGPRAYQRLLAGTGSIPWLGLTVRAQSIPLDSSEQSRFAVVTPEVTLLTGRATSGWEIDEVVIGEWIYSVSGERAGERLRPVAEVSGARAVHGLARVGGARARVTPVIRVGTGRSWTDLWNHLPALVASESVLAELAEARQLRVDLHPGGAGALGQLGTLEALLPILSGRVCTTARVALPPGAIPWGGVQVSPQSRARVQAALPVADSAARSGPRLWLGVEGAHMPLNAVDALGAVAARWCERTGGDVVVDNGTADADGAVVISLRTQPSAAALVGEMIAASAQRRSGGTARVMTTTGMSLQQTLALAGTADQHLCTPGSSLRSVLWVWNRPGHLLVGPSADGVGIARWFASQVADGIEPNLAPARCLSRAEGDSYVLVNVDELAEAMLQLAPVTA